MKLLERDRHILEHIRDYCIKIEKTVARFGKSFARFQSDADYIDSVSMNLLQIGELAGKFSDDFIRSTKENMDWRAIKNMRNMFAHSYGTMDIARIWDTTNEDIPILKQYCGVCLSDE